jgi:hypothetical protein
VEEFDARLEIGAGGGAMKKLPERDKGHFPVFTSRRR